MSGSVACEILTSGHQQIVRAASDVNEPRRGVGLCFIALLWGHGLQFINDWRRGHKLFDMEQLKALIKVELRLQTSAREA